MSGKFARESLNRLYKDFLRVCELWPVDPARTGRDYGEHMKQSWTKKLQNGSVDPIEAERGVNALMKISTNYYRNKYPRKHEISYTMQISDVYQNVLSNEGQNQVEPRRTWWERFSKKKKLGERIKERMEKEEKQEDEYCRKVILME